MPLKNPRETTRAACEILRENTAEPVRLWRVVRVLVRVNVSSLRVHRAIALWALERYVRLESKPVDAFSTYPG